MGLWLVAREPLVALLPRARQGRTAALVRCGAPRARLRPSLVPWWYVSAALGALTHVVWDAFTHLDRWGMRVFPVLGRQLAGAPLYWYLQYGGSAVAAVVIAVFLVPAVRRLPAGAPEGVPVLSVRERWWAGAVIGGCALVGAVQRASGWWGAFGSAARLRDLVPAFCFGAGAGLMLGVLVYAVGLRVHRPARVSGGSGGPGESVVPGRPTGAGRVSRRG